MASFNMTLKLLVDTESNRVLFAEADKDFVDLLFSFLSAPMGSIIKVLTNNKMVGSIGNLYESVEKLHGTYIDNKGLLLNPRASASSIHSSFLITQEPIQPKTYYSCASHAQSQSRKRQANDGRNYYPSSGVTNASDDFHPYVSNNPRSLCPSCNSEMSLQITYIGSKSDEAIYNSGKGYVKGVVMYMVMDDLVVMPMSTISSIALMKKFKVADVESLDDKVVDFGTEQALELLKASLQSKTALSDVFIKKVN